MQSSGNDATPSSSSGDVIFTGNEMMPSVA